jgi:glycosyltransferase involved in cell wall biosynthesis
MRILFLYTVIGRGGDAVQVACLIEAMRRLGHSVEVVGPHAIRPYTFVGPTHGLRRFARNLPRPVLDAAETTLNLLVALHGALRARRRPVDLVFERMTPYGPGGYLAARALRVPHIMHLDAIFADERKFQRQPLCLRVHKAVLRTVGRRAAVVAVSSEASARHYAAIGIPGERITILLNGVFAEDLAPRLPEIEGRPVIGYVGSMASWHRVDLLLRAFAQLRADVPDAQLWLVGDGQERKHLVTCAREMGLDDEAVKFWGPMDRTAALEAMDRFHVGVLPSTLDSGAPMKLFEYAARGVPMVVPDLPNLRRLWGDDAALYFPPGEVDALARSILTALGDHRLRETLRTQALERVRREYTWELQVGGILERVAAATPPSGTSETSASRLTAG